MYYRDGRQQCEPVPPFNMGSLLRKVIFHLDRHAGRLLIQLSLNINVKCFQDFMSCAIVIPAEHLGLLKTRFALAP